ncbi:MAG: hypothetical protein H0U23_17300 [Blastocatellia bacterium]|nr:hypothetical protein [Blastocatellia bacterium]
MFKRLAAILFILVMVGHVSASVCGCFGGSREDTHSCCKRQKVSGDSIKTKGCCDTNCMVQQSEKLAQDRTQAATKIKLKFQPSVKSSAGGQTVFTPIATPMAVVVSAYSHHRLKYARPPELYLRHQALLI